MEEKLRLIAKFSGVRYSMVETIYKFVQYKGIFTYEELRQLSNIGVPIVKWLKKVYGTRDNEMLTMIRHGEVKFEDFKSAIDLYYEDLKTSKL